MGKAKLIQDGVDHMKNVIAPTLNPTIKKCRFQVRIIGAIQGMAEVELRLVDQDGIVVQSFGSKTKSAGQTITLDGVECEMNFLPKDMG